MEELNQEQKAVFEKYEQSKGSIVDILSTLPTEYKDAIVSELYFDRINESVHMRKHCIGLAVTAYPRVVGDNVEYTKKAQEIYDYITTGKVKE